MSQTATDWILRVERGPDWLFVRLLPDPGESLLCGGDLVDSIWDMLQSHHANRLVLELDCVDTLDGSLLADISRLGTKVQAEGGLIRICGLSDPNLAKLRASPEAERVPHFTNREEAVGSRRSEISRPGKPR